jgi:hypothetical protein
LKTGSKQQPAAEKVGSVGESTTSAPNTPIEDGLSRYRVPGLVVLFVLLALRHICLPNSSVNMSHDLGSHMSFEFYARAKYLFGVDVIQNVGPYGYLSYPFDYSGILPTQKLLFGVIFGLILAWSAVAARTFFHSMIGKTVWFAALFLAMVPGVEEFDPACNLFVLLAAHYLLLGERDRKWKLLSDTVLCVALGLLCLTKFTETVLSCFLMLLVVVDRLFSRRWRDLAYNAGGFGITACVLWFLAGQRVSNVAAFAKGAIEFSKGYSEALSYAGKPELVFLGAAVLAIFAVANILRALKFRVYRHRLLTTIYECAYLYVIWKHGYNRAGHEFMFWEFIILAVPLLFLAHEAPLLEAASSGEATAGNQAGGPIRKNVSMYQLAGIPVALVVVCAILAARVGSTNPDFAGYANPWEAVVRPLERMASNVDGLVDWPGRLRYLKTMLEKNREDAALPEVKKVVGDSSIDMFGFLPGLILLNDLNYHPRPLPINFAATTPELMEKNAAFYQNDATAPKFLLAEIGQIDARFPPQDDALALPEVLEHYAPLLSDHGFLLLERTPGQPDLERKFISSTNVEWGDSIPMPPTGTNLLWCSADIRFSLMGRARSFVYQPPLLYIVLESPDRRLGPTRMLQSGASTGFLLRPVILNGVDFLAVYGRHAQSTSQLTPTFDNVRFVINREDEAFFEPDIKVSFWSVGPKK